MHRFLFLLAFFFANETIIIIKSFKWQKVVIHFLFRNKIKFFFFLSFCTNSQQSALLYIREKEIQDVYFLFIFLQQIANRGILQFESRSKPKKKSLQFFDEKIFQAMRFLSSMQKLFRALPKWVFGVHSKFSFHK